MFFSVNMKYRLFFKMLTGRNAIENKRDVGAKKEPFQEEKEYKTKD